MLSGCQALSGPLHQLELLLNLLLLEAEEEQLLRTVALVKGEAEELPLKENLQLHRLDVEPSFEELLHRKLNKVRPLP